MSLFKNAFEPRKQDSIALVKKSWFINEIFYQELQRLSNEKYSATINDLVVYAIDSLVENENIQIFPSYDNSYVKRSFNIPDDTYNNLEHLKSKYNLSITKLVNIAIYNALKNEDGNSSVFHLL